MKQTLIPKKRKQQQTYLKQKCENYTLKAAGKRHFPSFCSSVDDVVYLMTRGITLHKLILDVTIIEAEDILSVYKPILKIQTMEISDW